MDFRDRLVNQEYLPHFRVFLGIGHSTNQVLFEKSLFSNECYSTGICKFFKDKGVDGGRIESSLTSFPKAYI